MDDAGIDASGSINDAASAGCTPNEALRCENNSFVRCDGEGTAEVTQHCPLGCHTAAPRCADINPSNDLAPYLDLATSEPALNLGLSATIDTDSGAITADGASVVVKSALHEQPPAPAIRVFIVRNLTAAAVRVTGRNALAVVSAGDIEIEGVFSASAIGRIAGAGRFNEDSCQGGDQNTASFAAGGAGGGGFGAPGGMGGTATSTRGTASGGAAGRVTGNATLIPLRGGCDSGTIGAQVGTGGGAIQLVSRTQISLTGVIAANGSSETGGGSGGGILLEAPVVDIAGAVVANGGAGGGGCLTPQPGEAGRLDATPATRGLGCAGFGSDGGNGAAGNSGAGNGVSLTLNDGNATFAGHGGGGAGRIRVNTASGGLRVTGLFSPNPTTGAVTTR
ncbi:MAG: hypothetical protein H7138_14220 [Myxococcales bacterium]|nr:hypothetical protein [Myxococcales bacterium]